MDSVLNIIIQYRIVIIVVLVIVFMAIIGYIADKKKLIDVEKKEKQPKVNKIKDEKINEVKKPKEPLVETKKSIFDDDIELDVQEEKTDLNNEGIEENKVKEISVEKQDNNNVINEEELFNEEFFKIIPNKPLIDDSLKISVENLEILPIEIEEPKEVNDFEIKLPNIKNKEEL